MAGHRDQRPELPLDPDTPRSQEPGAALTPLHLRWDAVCLVAAGGVVGTLARYGLSVLEPTRTGRWPLGTFGANMLGAFVLGVLLEGLARRGADRGWRQRSRLLIGTGFCGSLTTFSTFAVEADLLIRDHSSSLALAYLGVSVIGGLLVAGAGIAAATVHHQRQTRRRSRPTGRQR